MFFFFLFLFFIFIFFAKTQKSKYEIKIMIEVNCAQLICEILIHFPSLSRRSPCGFRGLGARFQKFFKSLLSLKQSLITSVAMSMQGVEEGCVVTALRHNPGSNTKDSWETCSLQVCNRGCSSTYRCVFV